MSPGSSSGPSTETRLGGLAAFGLRKSLANDFRNAGCFVLRELGPGFVPVSVLESGSITVCRRMSVSLAMIPRRRRNGMMDGPSGRDGAEDAGVVVKWTDEQQLLCWWSLRQVLQSRAPMVRSHFIIIPPVDAKSSL